MSHSVSAYKHWPFRSALPLRSPFSDDNHERTFLDHGKQFSDDLLYRRGASAETVKVFPLRLWATLTNLKPGIVFIICKSKMGEFLGGGLWRVYCGTFLRHMLFCII